MIARCHFRFNCYSLVSVNFQWLQIMSSIFEDNVCGNNEDLMGVSRGYVVINGSMFNRNREVLYVYEGSAEFTNCIFYSNNASHRAVAFSVRRGYIRLTNCSLWNNTAWSDSSVLLARNSHVVLVKCIVGNNSATSDSRVISVTEYSTLLVESFTFENNSCRGWGGIIRAHRKASLNISHTIFHSNTALSANGGAIFLEDESSLEIDSCQFIGNRAALGGGAIMVFDHSSYSDTGSIFTNNTVMDNNGGGAILATEHSF